jgi:mannose-6-phosphate isomerase
MNNENIRPWGNYKVISKIKTITIKPFESISLQYHNKRDEFWQILKGSAKIQINNTIFNAVVNDTFIISKKINHRITGLKDGVQLLEIATGDVEEDDIIRLEDKYGR